MSVLRCLHVGTASTKTNSGQTHADEGIDRVKTGFEGKTEVIVHSGKIGESKFGSEIGRSVRRPGRESHEIRPLAGQAETGT